MTLHQAMEYVLQQNGGGWMDRNRIAAEIARLDLYRRNDGEHPPSSQLRSRARNATYRDLFECSEPGCRRIRLRATADDKQPPERPGADRAPAGVTGALTENDVVGAVCKFLFANGLEITSQATTHQRGVDINAQGDGYELLVEAKGGTSSKSGTKRFGKPFSSGQVTSHVSRAFYTAVALQATQGETRTAMALPRTPRHEQMIEPLTKALATLEVGLFWVDPDRQVELVAPWSLS